MWVCGGILFRSTLDESSLGAMMGCEIVVGALIVMDLKICVCLVDIVCTALLRWK